MAERLTDKTENSSLHNDDLLHSVDVSDSSSNAAGTSKKVKLSTLYSWVKTQIDSAYGNFVTRWPAWGEVTGKPTEFTPEAHTHNPGDLPNDGVTPATGVNGNHTINFTNSKNTAQITVNGDVTDLDISNAPDGLLLIAIVQDGIGRAVTLNSKFIEALSSSDRTIDQTAGTTTKLVCWHDNTLGEVLILKNIVT